MIKYIFKNMIAISLVFLISGCYGVPTKKEIHTSGIDPSELTPPENSATIVFIRPYHFYYFGYPVDVLINGQKSFSLPNQTYKKVFVPVGQLKIRGQSSTMGPPTRDIVIQSHPGEIIYLVWDMTAGMPLGVFDVNWVITIKDLADIYLKEVAPVSL